MSELPILSGGQGDSEPENNTSTPSSATEGKAQVKGGLASVVADDFDIARAMGGARGVAETIIPPILFIVLYLVTDTVRIPAIACLVIALGAIVVRLIQRIDIVPALSGFLVVVISAVWALKSGQASNYFILGIITNCVYLAILLLSLIVRWPLMGLIIGFLRGDPTGWKNGEFAHTPQQSLTRRRYWHITWLWVGLFAVRLLVQIPLFLTDAIAPLAAARIVMGPFLFAFVAWLTWMIVRSLPPVPVSESDDTTEENTKDEERHD
ncbi:MAG: DUF3159 domain-containing protein [Actinomycetaceae bacterium]|nr:DUF3159 domain-containing protein [Actinomycetaceae bacterium]